MSRFERKAQSERKHGPLPNSGASRAPLPPPSNRPGWKGPSLVKKVRRPQQPSTSQGPTSTIQEQLLPIDLQQLILNIFRETFPASNDFEGLKPTLQEIKDALFLRDFERAFRTEEYLEAYAIRWSPSRSLGYANLLAWVCGDREADAWVKRLLCEDVPGGNPAKVVCFGGGAAEMTAFAGMLRQIRSGAAGTPESPSSNQSEEVSKALDSLSISESASTLVDLHLVDIANWSSVVAKLHSGLTTLPTLSKYASPAARASNASFLSSGALKTTFTQANILDSSIEDLHAMVGPEPALLTLLFTLNELYTVSIPKTTAFLLKLTTATPKGSLLLVVDSPGSYSETAIGSAKEGEEKKKYPMRWLMDHVLLPKKGKKEDEEEDEKAVPAWEKAVDEESRWFRLEEGLRYPVSLENMRFQVHLFKRL